ncbi:MAG TPA: S41 family peptidase [Anaerolineae bacterium]
MKNKLIGLSLVIGIWLLSGCSVDSLRRATPTPSVPIDLPIKTQGQLRDFDIATASIQNQYINQKAADAWISQSNGFRAQVSAGMDDEQFSTMMSVYLGTMKDIDLSFLRPPSPTSISSTGTTTSTFSGIGIIAGLPVQNSNRLLVMNVLSGSPAASAGLKPHDSIIQIDGRPVTAEEGAAVLTRLRGPAGSKVTLTVHTPGRADRDIDVTRGAITAQSTFIYHRVTGTNIGYIQPDGASMDGMRAAISSALRDLSSHDTLDGLVLDLRIMQSPDFPVTDLLELFVNGIVGTLQTRTAKTKIEITGKNIAGSQDLPLVILVSDQTRGTAESFAGMLQDLGRARIVGTPTKGRLAIINAITLPNTGAAVLIPAGEYIGIKNTSWYGSGIKPDIPSDKRWEDFTDDDDAQLQQAVKALTRP